jgi:Ca2+-binding EF-hand superfamily protein
MAAFQQQATQLMSVTVPQGCYAGQLLQIQSPSGQILQVAIPQGLRPGQAFQVAIPVAQAMAQAPQPQGVNTTQLFQAVDTDRSGNIDKGELQRALSQGHLEFQERTSALLIRMFDTNHTGHIDFTQFNGLWNYLTQWKANFDGFDSDRSGTIDHGELTRALQMSGYQLSSTVVNSMLAKYDADRSGSISFDEYIQLQVELSILTTAFKRHDTSGTGRISINYNQFVTIILESRV